MHHSRLLRLLISSFFSICAVYCNGQHLEIRPAVYSGLFFFRGSAATTTSKVRFDDALGYYNPASYGKKSDFSYAVELPAQWVSKQKHIFGLGVGFEQLTSKAVVDSVFSVFMGTRAATGKVNITSTNLTVTPSAGHRFLTGPVVLDALIGVDWAFNLRVREEAALATPFKTTSQLKKQHHPADLRPRMQINASYKHIGISAGYSIGTVNLYSYDNPNFKNKKAYANFLRFGVGYRLK